MILEIIRVEELDEGLEVHALLEWVSASWDPQDEVLYTQECMTLLPEISSPPLSDSELIAVLDQVDPTDWKPVHDDCN